MTCRVLAGAVMVAALAVAGCEGGPGAGEAATPTAPRPAGTAVIRGVVRFEGEPPVMAEIASRPCHDSAQPLREETLVVDDAGGLRDVVVYLEWPGEAVAPPDEPAVLDQVDCRFVPHVLAVQAGQSITVKNSDPAVHNVHGQSERNPAFNFGMPGGSEKQVRFASPEAFSVRCDVHPWMLAWVHVFPHPYFAVTGGDGRYEIRGVPAGEYTLVFRHATLGRRQRQVTVGDGQVIEADQTYAPPPATPG